MKIKRWSYSALKTYETCPQQFRFRRDGVPEPPSPAMDRGSAIHGELEQYIGGGVGRLSKEVSTTLGELKRDMLRLRKHPTAQAEVEVSVDRRWRPVPWNDAKAWCRAKFDVREPVVNELVTGVRIIDHKTGRERPAEHADQLELYAVLEFSVNPAAEYVVGEIFYIDHGRKMSVLYDNRKFALGRLRDRWIERATKLLDDRVFEPTPGHGCRWCAFSRMKGGPCEVA